MYPCGCSGLYTCAQHMESGTPPGTVIPTTFTVPLGAQLGPTYTSTGTAGAWLKISTGDYGWNYGVVIGQITSMKGHAKQRMDRYLAAREMAMHDRWANVLDALETVELLIGEALTEEQFTLRRALEVLVKEAERCEEAPPASATTPPGTRPA